MTPDRKLHTIQNWIARLPEKDRIECVTMDMWGPYREAVHAELPGVPVVTDKFHVIKNLQTAFDKIRIELCREITPKRKKYLLNTRFLMLRAKECLDGSEKARLITLLNSFPELEEPYILKEAFRAIYKASSRHDAEILYDEWKTRATRYPQYATFAETVENWREEIFNYFDFGVTNAVTESLNNLCTQIASRGRGYSFDVLRAKILYGTKASKPAKFCYYTKKTDIAPSGQSGSIFSFAGFMPVRVDEKKERGRIEISSGTDIGLLTHYLQQNGYDLWNLSR